MTIYVLAEKEVPLTLITFLLLNSTTQIRPIDISFSDLLIKASGYPIPNAIISVTAMVERYL
jgi:hypothetical protein